MLMHFADGLAAYAAADAAWAGDAAGASAILA